MRKKTGFFLIIWGIVILYSLTIGHYKIKIQDLLHFSEKEWMIFLEIRLPRVLFASLSGASLAIVGCVLQAILKNKLIGPDIIGMTSGAGFGGVLGLLFFNLYLFSILFSFLFGMLSILIVLSLYRLSKRGDKITFILCGLIVSSTFSSGIAFLKYLADPTDKLPNIVYWLMGSFSYVEIGTLKWIAIPIIISLIYIYKMRYFLNILSGLEESEMKVIKINDEKIRWLFLIFSAIVISSIVSISGIINWIGLVIPNLMRPLIGEDHRNLLKFSAITGGISLLMIDNLCRVFTAAELPISLFTSLIGGPIFLYILVGERNLWKANGTK